MHAASVEPQALHAHGEGKGRGQGVGVSYHIHKERIYLHCSARTPPDATPNTTTARSTRTTATNEAARFMGYVRDALQDLSSLFP